MDFLVILSVTNSQTVLLTIKHLATMSSVDDIDTTILQKLRYEAYITSQNPIVYFSCRGAFNTTEVPTWAKLECLSLGRNRVPLPPPPQVSVSPTWDPNGEKSNTPLRMRGWRWTQFGRLERNPGTLFYSLIRSFWDAAVWLNKKDRTKTQGRGEEPTREKVRRATVHKLGRKYQYDWLYLQSMNSDLHLSQSPFPGQFFYMTTFCCGGYIVNEVQYSSDINMAWRSTGLWRHSVRVF